MFKPLTDIEKERQAKQLAEALINNDTQNYSRALEESKIYEMKEPELSRFKGRVLYLSRHAF